MSTKAKLRFGLFYDFRNPPAWKRPYDQLYGEIFAQIAWAEQHGFEDVGCPSTISSRMGTRRR